jgi:hypothetical protein
MGAGIYINLQQAISSVYKGVDEHVVSIFAT